MTGAVTSLSSQKLRNTAAVNPEGQKMHPAASLWSSWLTCQFWELGLTSQPVCWKFMHVFRGCTLGFVNDMLHICLDVSLADFQNLCTQCLLWASYFASRSWSQGQEPFCALGFYSMVCLGFGGNSREVSERSLGTVYVKFYQVDDLIALLSSGWGL